jgi:hypothetical protein
MPNSFPEYEVTKVVAERADRERAALVTSGYGDYEDFADVIRDHFKNIWTCRHRLVKSQMMNGSTLTFQTMTRPKIKRVKKSLHDRPDVKGSDVGRMSNAALASS